VRLRGCFHISCEVNPWSQGISPQFPGVLVGPPHVRKRHQMSSKEHIHRTRLKAESRPSSVGSLAPPPGHGPPRTPRLGGVYVSCQYFPCSFVLALCELGLRLGVKAQLPLRARSRGTLPEAGALAGYRTRISTCWLRKTAVSNSRLETIAVPRSPAQSRQSLPRRQRSHGR
jgi:hypothetical protein